MVKWNYTTVAPLAKILLDPWKKSYRRPWSPIIWIVTLLHEMFVVRQRKSRLTKPHKNISSSDCIPKLLGVVLCTLLENLTLFLGCTGMTVGRRHFP